MNRREAIQKTALLTGGAVFAPGVIRKVLSGFRPQPATDWNPAWFNESQAILIAELAETILPEDSHPGAKALGVPAFIETMVFESYPEQDRRDVIAGIESFNQAARSAYGRNFAESTPEQRHELAGRANREALQNQGGRKPFFLHIKELTILGYFTSKIGATEVLQHEPVPGIYQGCVPLDEVGKTWAV